MLGFDCILAIALCGVILKIRGRMENWADQPLPYLLLSIRAPWFFFDIPTHSNPSMGG